MLTIYDDRHYLIVPRSLGVRLESVSFADVTELPISITPSEKCGGILRVKGVFPFPRGVPVPIYEAIWSDASATGNRGMDIGNDAGMALARRVPIVTPYPIPKMLQAFGEKPRFRESRVAVTLEHLPAARDETYLVVKGARKRPTDLLTPLLGELAEFGFSAEATSAEEMDDLRSHIASWFSSPVSELQITRITTVSRDALFLVAALQYAVLAIEFEGNRGYDSVHLVAEIEGEPNYRPYWTSNR